MLYWLSGLSEGGDLFNLFRYITFRAGAAFFTALIFGFIFGRPLINYLRRVQKKGQPIRDDGPEGHFVKAGTPTMGGILILSALFFSTLLWARLDNGYVWIVLLVTMAFHAFFGIAIMMQSGLMVADWSKNLILGWSDQWFNGGTAHPAGLL